jgi:hypothetical protein
MSTVLREERDLNGITEANKRTVFRISRGFSRTGAPYLFYRLNEAWEPTRIGVSEQLKKYLPVRAGY